ncbi:MAG TPA: hypothetical protein VKY65_17860 [Alphaproteobacteria bacterium]|nr:hypothetical protein [Alphaproteobacteria bacterium]
MTEPNGTTALDPSTPPPAAVSAAPPADFQGDLRRLRDDLEALDRAVDGLLSREEARLLRRIDAFFHTPYGALAGLCLGVVLGVWADRAAAIRALF